jgi:salicylate hydroxylase
MADKPLSIAIIGGGIGGMAAALHLLHAGFDVHVYEQARAIGEIGAGIQISPNAARLLHRLGLAGPMAKTGVKPLFRHQRRWDDGRTLSRGPLGAAAEERFGAPYYNFHRADFIAILAAAVPVDRLHTGHRFEGLIDHGDTVEARFANGARSTCDLLIGADGIHSGVRAAILGPQAPTFTGCVAYRGLVPAARVRHLNLPIEARNWMGPGGHIVQYFVASRQLVNIVCVIEQDTWTGESWTDKGDVADVLQAFEGWSNEVLALLGSMDETYKWALFDRPPLERWTAGRVALLGDSCHAMLPFMAQGAVQSIEDGATLAACLRGIARPDIQTALVRYQTLRQPRASKLQAMSRANKTNFHLPDGPEQQARDTRMSEGATDWAFASLAWLYDHDASVLPPAGQAS